MCLRICACKALRAHHGSETDDERDAANGAAVKVATIDALLVHLGGHALLLVHQPQTDEVLQVVVGCREGTCVDALLLCADAEKDGGAIGHFHTVLADEQQLMMAVFLHDLCLNLATATNLTLLHFTAATVWKVPYTA